MKKTDKSQGIVFVLPKSREFFGRVSQDFQKTGLATGATIPIQQRSSEDAAVKEQIKSLKDIKQNLSKLSMLHKRLKGLLKEIDSLVKEEN